MGITIGRKRTWDNRRRRASAQPRRKARAEQGAGFLDLDGRADAARRAARQHDRHGTPVRHLHFGAHDAGVVAIHFLFGQAEADDLPRCEGWGGHFPTQAKIYEPDRGDRSDRQHLLPKSPAWRWGLHCPSVADAVCVRNALFGRRPARPRPTHPRPLPSREGRPVVSACEMRLSSPLLSPLPRREGLGVGCPPDRAARGINLPPITPPASPRPAHAPAARPQPPPPRARLCSARRRRG